MQGDMQRECPIGHDKKLKTANTTVILLSPYLSLEMIEQKITRSPFLKSIVQNQLINVLYVVIFNNFIFSDGMNDTLLGGYCRMANNFLYRLIRVKSRKRPMELRDIRDYMLTRDEMDIHMYPCPDEYNKLGRSAIYELCYNRPWRLQAKMYTGDLPYAVYNTFVWNLTHIPMTSTNVQFCQDTILRPIVNSQEYRSIDMFDDILEEYAHMACILSRDCDFRNLLMIATERAETTLGTQATRITIIDSNLKVLIDAYIRPTGQITEDAKKPSNTTMCMLPDTTITIKDIHKLWLYMVWPKSILVGHNLNYDLECCRKPHHRVIDVGLMYADTSTRATSLDNLTIKELGLSIRRLVPERDTVIDAVATLFLCVKRFYKDAIHDIYSYSIYSVKMFTRCGFSGCCAVPTVQVFDSMPRSTNHFFHYRVLNDVAVYHKTENDLETLNKAFDYLNTIPFLRRVVIVILRGLQKDAIRHIFSRKGTF
ncbi:bifunctional Ribonuclease H superfamily/Ribonuclease H-like superfamily/Exonuclease [Babesia duncani]|uniref:Bifunctional Ribonuclease H superfamily/Ribonuclease H-like superfamily/Exonuclease n=1 Tax=Babesia duncani TaxID=323732 RepID=A0AAD9UP50_9APIC|nr:bifunctional Ribonuclease H superfamily/Ribonuclease H-like superfamily/Exonuclease [Babesia duncani]